MVRPAGSCTGSSSRAGLDSLPPSRWCSRTSNRPGCRRPPSPGSWEPADRRPRTSSRAWSARACSSSRRTQLEQARALRDLLGNIGGGGGSSSRPTARQPPRLPTVAGQRGEFRGPGITAPASRSATGRLRRPQYRRAASVKGGDRRRLGPGQRSSSPELDGRRRPRWQLYSCGHKRQRRSMRCVAARGSSRGGEDLRTRAETRRWSGGRRGAGASVAALSAGGARPAPLRRCPAAAAVGPGPAGG